MNRPTKPKLSAAPRDALSALPKEMMAHVASFAGWRGLLQGLEVTGKCGRELAAPGYAPALLCRGLSAAPGLIAFAWLCWTRGLAVAAPLASMIVWSFADLPAPLAVRRTYFLSGLEWLARCGFALLNRVIRQRPDLILAFLGPLDIHYQVTEGFFLLFIFKNPILPYTF